MDNKVTIEYAITLPDGTKGHHQTTLNLPPGFKIEQLGQDPLRFVRNAFLLTCLSVAKGIGYGASWRSGEGAPPFDAEMLGAISNIKRKYDRVLNSVRNGQPAGRIDGNGDLSVYSMLYHQLLEKLYPEAYAKWLDKEVVEFINQEAKPDSPIVII